MTPRLPLCAFCGESLTRRARAVLTLDGETGAPSFGWHVAEAGDCAAQDPRSPFEGGWVRLYHAAAVIPAIEERGPGRVVYRRRKRS